MSLSQSRKLRIHYLQHVPFEGIGAIGDWASTHGHSLSRTDLFRATADPGFPAPADFDFLVSMGGPMNIYESETLSPSPQGLRTLHRRRPVPTRRLPSTTAA